MSKLQLPTVTLMCIDCIDPQRAVKVLQRCESLVSFGAVKFLTSAPKSLHTNQVKIMPLNSLISYSIFMLTNLYKYIDTEHVLIVQRDGWVLNAGAWNPAWLELDYIGPLFVQYDKVGSGGFSLRSKKIIQDIAATLPEWDGTYQDAHRMQSELNYYEDGVICLGGFARRYKFATLEQAADFAQGGNPTTKYLREYPFGFHRTWQEIDFSTGRVDSSDKSKSLHISYDKEIDSL